MISAKVLKKSITSHGHIATSFECVMPRFILAELNTHRMFSRNSASSRAIPFLKMVEIVESEPFIPIAWQKDHKGMQGTEYLDETKSDVAKMEWLYARDKAVEQAVNLNKEGFVTKQLCNRLLESFMWHKVIITATELENFFEQRCPQYEFKDKIFRSIKDYHKEWCIENGENTYSSTLTILEKLQINKGQAEIHMMALAEAMFDAYNETEARELTEDQWHLPYCKDNELPYYNSTSVHSIPDSVANCAHVSYTTFDEERKLDSKASRKLHDKLIALKHLSPLEHQLKPMTDFEYCYFTKNYAVDKITPQIESRIQNGCGNIMKYGNGKYLITEYGWCNNVRGFIQYRFLVDNQL